MGQRVAILLSLVVITLLLGTLTISVHEALSQSGTFTIAPSSSPLFFGSSGDVRVDVPKPGIAVRVEVPREFLQGVVSSENDTHFIQSNIRNDYYYYSVVDESNHWTYDWHGSASDGPCFKPNFAIRDPNAPWCVEIWNYLNGRWLNFTAPKFVLLHGLSAPSVAGLYNFTLFVANRTNTVGYPDFVHAWNSTLFVPVSMTWNPASLAGAVCDGDDPGGACPNIHAEGVVYARNVNTGQVARAYLNQALCTSSSNVNCGLFNVTGLAPGTYSVQASAGEYNGIAYSLTTYTVSNFTVSHGQRSTIGPLPLRRAPQVCGSIIYESSLNPGIPIQSLSGNPYLIAAGFKSPGFELNVTVEASDPWGHTYRFQGVSSDMVTGDSFRIISAPGFKYVGADPYGTEFAGLPAPEDQGTYDLTVNIWISGYLQKSSETVTIDQSPGSSTPIQCKPVSSPPVVMQTGGVISGTLEFHFNPQTLETPHQAEVSLGLTPTDALFGGNILIQAYDHSGLLRGLVVINGTLPNGKTSYADRSSLRFFIVGFTEYYNHSWSGVWDSKDYGLPGDSGYSLSVQVRGYEQVPDGVISVGQGANQSVTVTMIRGGAFQVTVASFDNRLGTRAIQAQLRWRFLNLSIPVWARVYFYNSVGLQVGFVERRMITGNYPDGVDLDSFICTFAGQNWSIRELWFYGYIPTHITSDTYTMRGYTLGYVGLNATGVSAQNELTGFSMIFIPLLYGNEIDITVPIFADPNLLGSTPEYDHAIGQVFTSVLAGAEMANLSAGTPTLVFTIFGFGGMLLNNYTMLGQGHFFYVSPDGTRYFDYGLDEGTYTGKLPEFGFTAHFLQVLQLPTVTFDDLFLELGVFLKVYQMVTIMQQTPVSGWNENLPFTVAALSWAQVQASNASYYRAVTTFDGTFSGVDSLQVPAGIYNITFTDVLFQQKIKLNFQVQWSGNYSLSPPGPLCPIGGIPGTCNATDLPIYFSLHPSSILVGECADPQNCVLLGKE